MIPSKQKKVGNSEISFNLLAAEVKSLSLKRVKGFACGQTELE